ncbi:COX15/CtaA family protein [Novosphingobium album (ex Liu et al. 2023)]|uniref:Heme A synthase n=1 Tax=Novosphingobium album (ex Liu et al. 2023) TaxID=3031130 RepID=A0ABT5WNW6_9SPHN|nr:COX15/CtaA family protein [Novosphingobium album (ex Liu et al. 2023)]MDE8651739.1 COX15/CtaA family protein [Novosphingobium album (ex Liu et al. 2023)]
MRIPDGRPLIGTSDDIAAIARWLLIVAALVVMIVVVGGITRLTESGLSITEWKPLTGAIPPLTEAQWQAEFAAYQRIPQYTEVNGPAGMTLADYKFIYFWEWVHRLLARLIGLAFALPLAWFWYRRTIPLGYKPRLLALLALGGLQGAVGWWMVSSGLSQDVKVSHFRLAAHLLVALTTLGGLVWTALDLKALGRREAPSRLTGFGAAALAVVAVQLFLGALVAGLRAGYVSGAGWFSLDAWPLMQGRFLPEGIDWSQGTAHALFSDPYLTHFLHRWWAWVVVIALVMMGRRLRAKHRREVSVALHSAFGLQIVLGVLTVWSGVSLWIAAAHQLVGALVLVATVWGAHALGARK